MEKKRKYYNKRLIVFGIFATMIFVLLGVRLYYIQIYKGQKFSEMALMQRSKEISLYPKRGIIFDKNLEPLTNVDTTTKLIIPKSIINKNKDIYDLVSKHTTLSNSEFYKLLHSNEYLLQIPVDEEFYIEDKPSSIFFAEVVDRYKKKNTLSHVIGYINKAENTGETGLERVYDEYLKINDKKSLIIEYDKSRTIVLNGTEYVNELSDVNNPSGVKLSIDSKIQNIVEKTLDENNIKGSVIIAEVDTGKILSMASRPNFNQDNIQEYLNNNEMALYNKAIQVGYPPGSIFKVVVLLAALESETDFINRDFYCDGFEEINNVKISCTSKHGEINLEDAFANSCNSAFIQIGKEIGGKKIIDLAKRLGFGNKINIGLVEEIEGNLPKGNSLLGPAIGNISIGQGEIEATPLQITNLLMIIANNGVQKHLTLIEGVTNKEGKILKEYNKEPDVPVISSTISNIAYDYLISVVKNGTGRYMDVASIGGAGGKTGSAEAIFHKEHTIHGWFSGFYPVKNPKYVITVLVENGGSGSKSAAPIFEKISKEINKIYPVY
jgi:peptidoglycan glycosyltransferase/penicillin-binding protein 2